MLPLPLSSEEAMYQTCCGKTVCVACVLGMTRTEMADGSRDGRFANVLLCPFCRAAPPKGKAEVVKRVEDRIAAGDAEAVHLVGMWSKEGSSYWKQDPDAALEHWFRAARMGWTESHRNIGDAYDGGYDFLPNDPEKARYHYSLAAVGVGDVVSRYNLGVHAANSGDYDLAYRHWCIVAKQGNDTASERAEEGFQAGYVTREEYEEVRRMYGEAVDSMTSNDRRMIAEEKPHLPSELRNKPVLKGGDVYSTPLPPPRFSSQEESTRSSHHRSFEHFMGLMFWRQEPSPSETKARSDIERLHVAVRDGQLGRVQRLLKRRPDLATMQHYKFGSACMPLEIAATSHHEHNLDIAKLLVDNGADVHHRDAQFGQQPLHRACEKGVLEMISFLIDRCGADPNSRDGMGQTCLHYAAEHGHEDACRLLLESGAGPSLRVKYECKTPRQWAERGGHHGCARIL